MRSPNPLPTCKILAFVLLFCVFGPAQARAQAVASNEEGAQSQPRQGTTVVAPPERVSAPAARETEVACGGFIEQTPPAQSFEIVGAKEERERRVFAQGDTLFISAGSQHGVTVGQEFSVVRPRGQFRTKYTRKDGSLGVYTQEVGRIRVVRVRGQVSVAEVVNSCDNLLFGDLLRPAVRRTVPPARASANLDAFAEPTGKQTGRIVLARDGRELLSLEEVVFIDLGAEDNVKVGDYLTVFRTERHGEITRYGKEIANNSRDDYQSKSKQGGKFSNQAQRLKDVDGGPGGSTVKTPDIKRRRPAVPRKVVGEIVVLRVEGRTATAVITRVIQEVHTGDHVEVQ